METHIGIISNDGSGQNLDVADDQKVALTGDVSINGKSINNSIIFAFNSLVFNISGVYRIKVDVFTITDILRSKM
ncbi:hypothetical protein AYI69_g2220 [Smittium culicis]|uniref:Velvet domain-containing protein n=1 Tax=Smittium culicis TaxID=133412 RepID=A0A1R1YN91_9FUNG|nr:hypothetical protein AYI69_g2220 [Smittium culicis]